MDTIYALASARGKAGVSVIRLSGPRAFEAASQLMSKVPEPRKAGLRRLRWKGVELDQALVLTFEMGASFTGEAVVELHVHGSVAVTGAVLSALSEIAGCRLAEPGEFTRRALENGQLDLAQVEGLADLIDAETEAQRRQALEVLSGAIGDKVEGWRADIMRAAALIEATIDFVDEDVPVDVTPEVRQLVTSLLADLQREVQGSRAAERIREGFEIAIIGQPNAGKSTLLNALAGRDAAITSEHAGTTRDVIEVRMDLDGLAVTILDTAGLRETDDPVEALGISLATKRANAADLRVFLRVGDEEFPDIALREGDLNLRGKADLGASEGMSVSGKTGQGVSELIAAISAELQKRVTASTIISRERHRIAILDAIEALESVLDALDMAYAPAELLAEELRRAMRALESILGRVDVEMLLGEIFSRFCIGK